MIKVSMIKITCKQWEDTLDELESLREDCKIIYHHFITVRNITNMPFCGRDDIKMNHAMLKKIIKLMQS